MLRIRFEDLVLKYDHTLKKIYDFLGENKETHVNKKRHFDPLLSSKNIGLWKNYPHKNEIDKIYFGLKDYCCNI